MTLLFDNFIILKVETPAFLVLKKEFILTFVRWHRIYLMSM
jgi:hypothetical protein